MPQFNSKEFNPQAFGLYVDRVPNTKKNALAKSRAIGTNRQARHALSNQSGQVYGVIPYYGLIDPKTSQNNTGGADIEATTTTTYKQGFVVARRMDGFTEVSFADSIVPGANFMDNVAQQISEYKTGVKQNILLSMLKGIYSMSTTGSTVKAKAAKEFINKHTTDITDAFGVTPEAANKAIQKACGDNKSTFKIAIMDSTVATDLENQKLLKFLTQTDANGIEIPLTLATWNGRLVIIDDDMPTEVIETTYKKTADEEIVVGKRYFILEDEEYIEVATPVVEDIGDYYEIDVEGHTKHTTYLVGENVIVLDDIGDAHPYEMYRDPKKNGGEDTLYIRDGYICGFNAPISFVANNSVTTSASNADLENGANWEVVNDGRTAVSTKAIAIARLISKSLN